MQAPREDYPEDRGNVGARPTIEEEARVRRDEEISPRRFPGRVTHEEARAAEESAVVPPISDIVRWGPILAGTFFTLAALITLGMLAFAVRVSTVGPGATTGDILSGAGIFGGIAMLVSLFFGGFVAARTAGLRDAFAGGMNGLIVWAFTIFLALILSALGAGGLFGSVIGGFGIFAAPSGTLNPATLANTSTAAWVIFGALLISAIVAVIGGIVGAMIAPATRFRFWRY